MSHNPLVHHEINLVDYDQHFKNEIRYEISEHIKRKIVFHQSLFLVCGETGKGGESQHIYFCDNECSYRKFVQYPYPVDTYFSNS